MATVLQSAISIVLPSLRGGGAERVMLNIANALVHKGYTVDLVLVAATGPYLAEVENGITVVNLASNHSSTSIPALISYLRRRRPRVLISSLPHISIATLIARHLSMVNCRAIIVEHNTISQTVAHSSSIKTKLLPLLMRLSYKYSDAIVGVSKGVALDLEAQIKLPSGSITVIYNPVITGRLEAQALETLDHPWFQLDSPPVVVGIGRLTPAKNFSLLIDAFNKVRQKQEAKLVILGDGQERSELEALTSALGLHDDVSLPGFVPNPYNFLKHCAVFVLSSRWEGLPTVLIEALACGAPVLSTDCPSGPREILRGGKLGSLVSVNDSESLAAAIIGQISGNSPLPTVSPNDLRVYRLDYALQRYEELINQL